MSKKRTLVFAGTIEGHQLAEALSDLGIGSYFDFSVATDYGKDILEDIEGINVIHGRMLPERMKELFSSGEYAMVVDSTHPYAKVVTDNIKEAVTGTDCRYIRLFRDSTITDHPNLVCAGTIEKAVEILNSKGYEGNVLLTTGAKELAKYKDIRDFDKRVFARVLPSIESIEICQSVGLPRKNIIGMQGPFHLDMNIATMKQYDCQSLVTKNTGTPGGFEEKVSLGDEGYKIIVIERPTVETGLSADEVLERLKVYYGK